FPIGRAKTVPRTKPPAPTTRMDSTKAATVRHLPPQRYRDHDWLVLLLSAIQRAPTTVQHVFVHRARINNHTSWLAFVHNLYQNVYRGFWAWHSENSSPIYGSQRTNRADAGSASATVDEARTKHVVGQLQCPQSSACRFPQRGRTDHLVLSRRWRTGTAQLRLLSSMTTRAKP